MLLRKQALSHNIRHAAEDVKDKIFNYIREIMNMQQEDQFEIDLTELPDKTLISIETQYKKYLNEYKAQQEKRKEERKRP